MAQWRRPPDNQAMGGAAAARRLVPPATVCQHHACQPSPKSFGSDILGQYFDILEIESRPKNKTAALIANSFGSPRGCQSNRRKF